MIFYFSIPMNVFIFLYPYECFYTSIIYIRINCYNHFDTEKKKCKDTVTIMAIPSINYFCIQYFLWARYF